MGTSTPAQPFNQPFTEPPTLRPVGAESGGVREVTVRVEGHDAHAFVGGRGDDLVLVHGGWGGAATHWRAVWGPLSDRFHVIAPNLPGIGDTVQPGLGSLGGYARWLGALLDELEVPNAWFVGNSFGVSLISRFALDFPRRCRGLVFVNGFPLRETPPFLRWLGERRMGQRLMRTIEKQVAYRPGALQRGFFDTAKVPEEIRAMVQQKAPPQAAAVAEVLIRGGGPASILPVAPVLLWGEEDHLPGTNKHDAEQLRGSLRASRLVFVPRAGHMPQVENPRAFVDALVPIIQQSTQESDEAQLRDTVTEHRPRV